MAQRTQNAFTGIFLCSLSMVVNRIHLHLALVVLENAIFLKIAKCPSSLGVRQFHRILHDVVIFVPQYNVCLCKFVCIVEQNGQGLGILLFFFINLPVPGATVCSNRGTTSGICSCFTLAEFVIPLTTSLCGSEPIVGNCIGDSVILLGKKRNLT